MVKVRVIKQTRLYHLNARVFSVVFIDAFGKLIPEVGMHVVWLCDIAEPRNTFFLSAYSCTSHQRLCSILLLEHFTLTLSLYNLIELTKYFRCTLKYLFWCGCTLAQLECSCTFAFCPLSDKLVLDSSNKFKVLKAPQILWLKLEVVLGSFQSSPWNSSLAIFSFLLSTYSQFLRLHLLRTSSCKL